MSEQGIFINNDDIESVINILIRLNLEREDTIAGLKRELENLHQDIARFHSKGCPNWKIPVANCCEGNDVTLNAMEWMLRARNAEKLCNVIKDK